MPASYKIVDHTYDAVVVGAVVGTRNHNNSSSASTKGGSASANGSGSGADDSSPSGQAAAASSAAAVLKDIGVFPTATDSLYLLPLYPSTVSHPQKTLPV